MKNDLTSFEKDILKIINITHNKKYTYKNLMEWNSNRKQVENNLKPGEIIYEALGCFVAIKENK